MKIALLSTKDTQSSRLKHLTLFIDRQNLHDICEPKE